MAKTRKDVIIVPWDYSEASEIALQHAILLANEVDNQIMLVRFIKEAGLFGSKSAKQAEYEAEKVKIKEVAAEIVSKYNLDPVRIFIDVEIGTKSKVVDALVKDANANLVVCGRTYKLTDKQTLDIREITDMLSVIDIPFIIATTAPTHAYYKEIVVPLDNDKKMKETLQWVVYLSKYYNCNINIIKPYIENEYMKKDMENNIYFTKKLLDKKNIIYGIKTAKKGKVFEDEILKFSVNIDSDLVVLIINKFKKMVKEDPNYDATIPFLVINRNSEVVKYGGSFR
ncbi:MAG: universal stress protein [Salinivirgaceae bacterium]|nr:universal stress protein [Salinivirgaceae bacterium]MBO7434145.1 universal stress protein [Salinivirgaceae bacterium]MBR5168783.1 universal stress protein [Salinivirgaceae bacterium]